MSISSTIVIERPCQAVFAVYEDVNSWAQWDPDVEAVGVNGPFEVGTTGWLKPVGAPRTKTTLTEVQAPYGFTVESTLPLCTMSFRHILEPVKEGTAVTHTVEFSGLLAPVFSRLIGAKIERGIDGTLSGLKAYVEAQ